VRVVASSAMRSIRAGVAARGVDCECAMASLVAALAAVTVMAQRTVAAVCNRADGKGADTGRWRRVEFVEREATGSGMIHHSTLVVLMCVLCARPPVAA
jgi:hypothetical protein